MLDEWWEMLTCQGHMTRIDNIWHLMNLVDATKLIEIDWYGLITIMSMDIVNAIKLIK